MREGAEYFLRPADPAHRRYAALRAFFVEEKPAPEVAQEYGVSANSVNAWATRFRKGDLDPFYATGRPGPRPESRDPDLIEAILAHRQRRLNVYEISQSLAEQGFQAGHTLVWQILAEQGMTRLPKRTKKQRQNVAPIHGTTCDIAELDLTPGRTLECRAPLALLFAPHLSRLGLPDMIAKAGYPGTNMIPPLQSVLSLLELKLLNKSRRNHASNITEDPGLGLLAGLNVLPKTTKLHDYSYGVPGDCHRALLQSFIQAIHAQGTFPTSSFNLDTHVIRHHGENAVLEKNYVPRRSQSTKSILVMYSQEHGSRTLVYGTSDELKSEKVEAVLRFADFWKNISGKNPEELVLDSRLTTTAGLAELKKRRIRFITLRTRHPSLVERVQAIPDAKWKSARVDVRGRKFKNPRVLDEEVTIKGYGKIRQIVAKDMGKDTPMFLITNDRKSSPSALLTRYALRTPIENSIGEQVGFFHVDALSSDARIKIDMDIVLDVIASQLYHWFQSHLRGFDKAEAATAWREFLDRKGTMRVEDDEIIVRVRPFKHAPTLMAATQLLEQQDGVSWLGGRRVRVEFGR